MTDADFMPIRIKLWDVHTDLLAVDSESRRIRRIKLAIRVINGS